MVESGSKFEYLSRQYKNVAEFAAEDNEHLRSADINSLILTDERVHTSTEGSKIVEFFKGKSVFVTGGTGFLGILLIEKLLRTCRDIDTLYILVRPKHGRDANCRLDEIFNSEIFSELKKVQCKFRHKVVPIPGDISLPDMGISGTDKEILFQKVGVIFHVAATVRFDEKITLAAAVNVCGTVEVLRLAQRCKNLSSLVYVSTIFSNCKYSEIGEKFYEPSFTPDELREIIEINTDKYLEQRKHQILRGWPNTYTFTKAIAENAIKMFGSSLPACIFRPGIVTSTYKEPLKGWINNFYGPMGAVVAIENGIMRSSHCDPDKIAEIVPADYTINGMMAAAYQNQFNEKNTVKIYNFISSVENPMTWKDFHDLSMYYALQNPPIKAIWYVCSKLNRNYLVHSLYVIFLHFFSAILIDACLILVGQKARMVKLYRKIGKFTSSISFFATRQWKIQNDNTQELWRGLSDTDKKLFTFSMKSSHFNWNSYMKILAGGIRLHLLKDDMSTIPEAIKRYRRLYYYHKILLGVGSLIAVQASFWILSPVINYATF